MQTGAAIGLSIGIAFAGAILFFFCHMTFSKRGDEYMARIRQGQRHHPIWFDMENGRKPSEFDEHGDPPLGPHAIRTPEGFRNVQMRGGRNGRPPHGTRLDGSVDGDGVFSDGGSHAGGSHRGGSDAARRDRRRPSSRQRGGSQAGSDAERRDRRRSSSRQRGGAFGGGRNRGGEYMTGGLGPGSRRSSQARRGGRV